MHLLITSHLSHTDNFWHPEHGPPSFCILYIFFYTLFYSAHYLDDHLQLTTTWRLLDLLKVNLLHLLLCLSIHLHTIHTHVLFFTDDNICDPEKSPSDSVDPFITQTNSSSRQRKARMILNKHRLISLKHIAPDRQLHL